MSEIFEKKKKDFLQETEEAGDAIEMAFRKKKIDARKVWLCNDEPGTFLDQSVVIKYSDFVNKELILLSMADLLRSIPSVVDGLKPGQQKLLFCSSKCNFLTQAKVAQFQVMTQSTLLKVLVEKIMQVVDACVFTFLSPITSFIFPKDDGILLDYLKEDGQQIEPSCLVPEAAAAPTTLIARKSDKWSKGARDCQRKDKLESTWRKLYMEQRCKDIYFKLQCFRSMCLS